MPTIFTTYETYLKIGVILIYTAFIWYCHGIYDDHKEVKQERHEIVQIQTGTNNIIKFHQELSKTHANKDTCFNTKLPTDLNSLLK